MEEVTLNFSRETLKERKKVSYLILFMIPIMVVVYAFILMKSKVDGDSNQKLFFTIIGVVVFLIMVEMIVIFRIMFKKISEMKLIVTGSFIKRVGGKFEEVISYEDIQKVTVKRNTANRILYIKLKHSRGNINLAGFEDMDYLFHQIKVNMLDESKIVEIKNKVNWNNPIAIFVTVAITFLACLLLMLLDIDVYEMFNLCIPVFLGAYVLFTKPISKNAGARFRILEIVLSCVVIGSGLIRLIGL